MNEDVIDDFTSKVSWLQTIIMNMKGSDIKYELNDISNDLEDIVSRLENIKDKLEN